MSNDLKAQWEAAVAAEIAAGERLDRATNDRERLAAQEDLSYAQRQTNIAWQALCDGSSAEVNNNSKEVN